MKQLVEFPLEGTDKTIWVEVDLQEMEDEDGEFEVSRAGDTARRAIQTFQEALDVAKPVAEAIIGKLSSLSERPQEIDVEFGLKLSAKAGAVISSTGIDANFKVTLKWKQG